MTIIYDIAPHFVRYTTYSSTQKSKWSVHLNGESTADYWFIKHRKDYGSYRFLYTVGSIYYLIAVTVLLFIAFLSSSMQNEADIGFFLIEFTVLMITWYKTPDFSDVFGIKRELQLLIRLAGICLLLYVIWDIKTMFYGFHLWSFMSFQLVVSLIVSAMGLILNGFVFHRQLTKTKPKKSRISINSVNSKILNKQLALTNIVTSSSKIFIGSRSGSNHFGHLEIDISLNIDANTPHSPVPPSPISQPSPMSPNTSDSAKFSDCACDSGTLTLKTVLGNNEYIDCFFNHICKIYY